MEKNLSERHGPAQQLFWESNDFAPSHLIGKRSSLPTCSIPSNPLLAIVNQRGCLSRLVARAARGVSGTIQQQLGTIQQQLSHENSVRTGPIALKFVARLGVKQLQRFRLARMGRPRV